MDEELLKFKDYLKECIEKLVDTENELSFLRKTLNETVDDKLKKAGQLLINKEFPKNYDSVLLSKPADLLNFQNSPDTVKIQEIDKQLYDAIIAAKSDSKARREIDLILKARLEKNVKDKLALEHLIECIDEDNKFLNQDNQYQNLFIHLYFYVKFKLLNEKKFDYIFNLNLNKEEKNSIVKKIENIYKFYLKRSLNNNSKIKLKKCFDENADFLQSGYIVFNNFISNLKNERLNRDDVESCRNLFINDSMKEKQSEIIKIEEENRVKNKEEKRQEKIQNKIKSRELSSKMVYYSQPTIDEKTDLEIEIYSKYINEKTMQLKNDVIDKISLNELLDILRKEPKFSKKMIEKYKNEYIKMIVNKETDRIINLLSKDEVKLLKSINKMQNEKSRQIFYQLEKLILSEEYSELSNEQIKTKVKKIISGIPSNSINEENTNLIIFPYFDFYKEETNFIINNFNNGNDSGFHNSFGQLFAYLRTQNMLELSSNGHKAFHEIKDTSSYGHKGSKGTSLIINPSDAKLKAYRFGKGKNKLCITKLSVTEKNQIMLKERYGCRFNPHVIMCFSLGNVSIEDEASFYVRANKNASIYEEEILHINKLFRNDFTNETFNEACTYIDTAIEQIDNIKKGPELD